MLQGSKGPYRLAHNWLLIIRTPNFNETEKETISAIGLQSLYTVDSHTSALQLHKWHISQCKGGSSNGETFLICRTHESSLHLDF